MRVLILTFLLTSCAQDAYIVVGDKTEDQGFVNNLPTFSSKLTSRFLECPGVSSEDINNAFNETPIVHITEGIKQGAYFRPSRTIVLNRDTRLLFSFFGHELARLVLYHKSNEQWRAKSEGNANGWEQTPMGCMWTAAETLSLEWRVK